MGLLNSWDNCRELCTSCYRSCCLSSTRMGQHSSVACQPEALFKFLRFQRPPYSIYVALPCPSQGLISFPQCGRAGIEGILCVLKPVIYKSSKGAAAGACVGVLWGCLIPPAQNLLLGWEPTFFAGQCHGFRDKCRWSFVCCHLAVRHTSCPLPSASISSVGELKGTIRNPDGLETVYREQKAPCPLDTSTLILVPFTWINNSCCYSSVVLLHDTLKSS